MTALRNCLLALWLGALAASSALASPLLNLVPSTSQLRAGETLALDIVLSGLHAASGQQVLGAFDLTLHLDPGIFSVLPGSAVWGQGLGDAGDPSQVLTGIDDSMAGAFRFYGVSLLERSAAQCVFCTGHYLDALQPDGNLLLARLTLVALSAPPMPDLGVLSMWAGDSSLAEADGQPIPSAHDPQVAIAVPQPPMAWLVGVALVALGAARRNRQRPPTGLPARAPQPGGRRAHALVALGVVAAALAGCGGGDAPPAAPAAGAADATAAQAPVAPDRQALAWRLGAPAPAAVPVLGANFTASTYKFNTGNPPPDSMGAVGPDHFVEMINSRFAVYDKATGQVVRQSTLDAFWQGLLPAGVQLTNPYSVGFPSGMTFDPRLLYDSAEQRWYAVADANMDLMVAVSDGPDPTRGWKAYQLDQHHTWAFDLPASVPVADLLADLNDTSTVPNPGRLLMTELGKQIGYNEPGAFLITQVIEAGRRWGVLCRFPHPLGFIGGCNGESRIVQREGDRFRVYDWPRIDFPTLGMDADNLYVATQFSGAFFTVPKAGLRNGTPPRVAGVRYLADGPRSGQTQPLVDQDGGGAGRALAVVASRSALRFVRLARLGCSDAFDCELAANVPLTAYDSPWRAAQPGSKRSGASSHAFIPDESELTANLVLVNGEVHGVQAVCNTVSCANGGPDPVRLRYFRIRVDHDAATDSFRFEVLDDLLLPNASGTAALNTFYGSVAVNRDRQVVVGFTGSNAAVHAGSYAVVGQLDATGAHMQFSAPLLLKAGHNEHEIGAESGNTVADGRNRLGDYSATTVDPRDPTRFWTIQEWISGLDVWSTQVTEIRLQPASGGPAVLKVTATARGAASPPRSGMLDNVRAGDAFGDLDKGIAIPNGQFIITPNLRLAASAPRYPVYTAQDFPLGDGRNEATEGAFNFTEDAGHARFAHFQSPRPAAPLQFATLELQIVAGADCANDTLTLGTLPPIEVRKIFPAIAAQGCRAGNVFTGTVNLLQLEATGTGRRYTSADILDAMAATPWSLRFTYRSHATVTLARLSLGVPGVQTSLVGDVDNFSGGDAADVPPRSSWVATLVDFIAGLAGQGPGANLDQGGADRPVGLSHVLAMPAGARITGATLKFRVQGADALVYNDGVYYNDTRAASPLLPVIALRDLLGREPLAGEVLTLQVNLARVPVRTSDSTAGPGGHWSAAPDAWRNLLAPLARDGRLDLVFSDDLNVNHSELTVRYVGPDARPGDLTGDDLVDQTDLDLLMAGLNTDARGDPRDLDGDGRITVLDARRLVLLCSRPRCALN